MAGNNRFRIEIFSGYTMLAAVSFFGCASRKPAWIDLKNGVVLEYRMPEKEALRYRTSSHMIQTTKFGEQSMVTRMDNWNVLSMLSKGKEGDGLRIHVTVDSARMDIQSPAGNMSPDMGSIIGKGFDMTVSSLGKEIDVSEAANLKYNLGPSGERTLGSEFQTFFEDLPVKPLKQGDTWTSADTLNVDQAGTKMTLLFNNLNTFQAVEKVQGLNCVRIQTESTGTMNGSGEQGGAKFDISGTIKASGTWHFAVQEGILVKASTEATTESSIQISGPQTMTLPMTMIVKGDKTVLR
jgi:hypothetical protein